MRSSINALDTFRTIPRHTQKHSANYENLRPPSTTMRVKVQQFAVLPQVCYPYHPRQSDQLAPYHLPWHSLTGISRSRHTGYICRRSRRPVTANLRRLVPARCPNVQLQRPSPRSRIRRTVLSNQQLRHLLPGHEPRRI